MERNSFMDATSPKDERFEALKQLYPELIRDNKLNLEALKDLFDEESFDEGEVGYNLYWPGKRDAKKLARKEAEGTLEPVIGDGVNEDKTSNIYIEGDNLEVLRCLKKSYGGRVKMIYIDPPYNTGKDFIYPDNFAEPVEDYLKFTRQVDEQGVSLVANPKSSGAYHRKWLDMMLPRLLLARELLTNDGAIFIHIDEHEVANLRLICCEIFGEENDLGTIIWDKRNPKGESSGIAYQHESILCFAKNIQRFSAKQFSKKKEHADEMLKKASYFIKKYNGVNNQSREEYKKWVKAYTELTGGESAYCLIDDNENVYQPVSMAAPDKPETRSHRALIHPVTGKPCPVPEKGWRYKEESLNELLRNNRIEFGKDENTQPRQKYFLKENIFESVSSLIYFGGSDSDTSLTFDNPKPLYIAKKIIWNLCKGEEEEIVMDFFSGTATTAHATIALNCENFLDNKNGNLHFLMVQLPINLDSRLKGNGKEDKTSIKNAIELLDSINKPHTICEIGKERIRRAGKKILEEHPELKDKLDVGFKVYRLAQSNIEAYKPTTGSDQQSLLNALDAMEKQVTPLRDGLDLNNSNDIQKLLTEIMLRQGFALDSHIEKTSSLANNTVYRISDEARPIVLHVCLDSEIKPETVKSIRFEENDKFVCLNSAISDELYAQLSDKGRVETI